MTGDLSFEKRTKKGACCFTVLWQCPHNRPSRHGYLLATDYKNHPNRTALDFKAKIKSQMSEFNHNGQQENLMQIFMSDHRELFGLVKNYDSPFFFVCIVICLLRYYVYIFFM